MTATDLALVLATVLCVLGFVALVVVLGRVLRALRELQDAVASLRAETAPLLADLQGTVVDARASIEEARDDLERFDELLGSAEAIADNMHGASRVARAAFSAPMIKTVALASGTSRAARRLRRRGA